MRKVRTASGAVAVQVARKDRGRVVILAHVGSADTDAELGILLDEARQIVTGEQVAFAIEVPARRTQVADVPDWRTSTLISAPSAPAGAPVGSGRTVGDPLTTALRRPGCGWASMSWPTRCSGIW